jgi:glycosyltransferase involved in cell wall biosynthesis
MVVLVDDGPDARVQGLYLTTEERDGPLEIVRLSYRPRAARIAYMVAVLELARRLRRSGKGVDVVHAHVHWMGWPAVIAGRLLRRPVVISEHSSEWSERTLSPGALRRARIAFRRAALVCPVSRALRASIETYGVEARFRVVPNAADTRIFHPPQRMANAAPTRLVNVALHEEIKGLDMLLQAFALLATSRSDIDLELIGDGPRRGSLERLASELGIADRVQFRGALSPLQVSEALRAADLFVLASRSETLGAAVIEALCSGLPVVATAVGGVPEVIGERDGVLVPSGDPELLAAGIGSVLDGYGKFDRPAIARRAEQRFSRQAIGAIWDEIYRAL